MGPFRTILHVRPFVLLILVLTGQVCGQFPWQKPVDNCPTVPHTQGM